MNERDIEKASVPSPQRLLFTALAIVSLVEIIIMLLMPIRLKVAGGLSESMFDGLMLILLSAPLLWWLIVRPLRSAALGEKQQAVNILSHVAEGIITLDEDGNIRSFNPAAEQIFGYREVEVIGKPITLLMPRRFRSGYQKDFKRASTERKLSFLESQVELYGLRKDGCEFSVEFSWAAWSKGKKDFFAGIFRDISERKRTEKELQKHREHLEELVGERTAELQSFNEKLRQEVVERRQAEEELKRSLEWQKAIFEGSRDAIFISDADAKFIEVNQAACDLTGYSKTELLKMGIPDLHEKMDLSAYHRFHHRIMAGEEIISEAKILRKDGGKVDAEFNNRRILISGTHYMHTIARDITERKQAEKALLESEEKFKSLAEESPNMIFINKNGRVVYANKKCEEIMGYTKEEFCSPEFSFLTLAAPECREQAKENFARHMRGEDIPPCEYTLITKDHKRIEAIHTTKLISYGGEKAILEIVTDITERKRMEDALRKSEDHYRSVVDNAKEGIVVTQDRVLKFANPKVETITGYTKVELLSRPFLNFVHPDDRERVMRIHIKRLKGEEVPSMYQLRIIDKQGQTKWLQSNGVLIEWESKPATLNFLKDITEHRWMELQLRKLSLVVEQSPSSIIITDLDGNIEYVNAKFTQATGYGYDEVIGRNPRILKSGKTPEVEYRQLWETITSGREWRGEFHNKKKNGELFWESAVILPIKNADGEITNFIGIKEDITEQKQAEEEMAKFEKQLRQAQKMEALGTLAGGIAHDFNNILGAILGYAEMTIDDTQPQSIARENLQEILRAGNRAKDLVKQILTFSRQSEQHLKPVKLSPIIREAIKLLRASLPASIEIHQNIDPESGTTMADPSQIHQIIINLCTNAGHAMREGGGIMEVSLEDIDIDSEHVREHPNLKPGRYAKITVGDNGEGMDPEILERIFDPFFTTKSPGEGTGLGLSVVHGIVKNHGGDIAVHSEPGKGTKFDIYLPGIDEKTRPEAPMAKAASKGNERILCVDDEAMLVRVIKQMLERLGYETVTKTSGLEALKEFQCQPDKFDLVITDQTMPQLSGADLATQIMDIRPDVPIILCSGFSEEITPEKAKTLGIREFILKPISIGDLSKAVRRALDKSQD